MTIMPLFTLGNFEIEGLWLTQKQDAIVEIFQKNSLYYGKIVWLEEAFEEDGSPKMDTNNPDVSKHKDLIIGLEILKGFKTKKKKWSGGTIYDPDNGKTYSCTIKHKDGDLLIRGFIGISLLGRTEVWTRTELPKPAILDETNENEIKE
jgi:uncharacterized protein (DUF2147 family)